VQKKTINNFKLMQTQSNKIDFSGQNLYVGFDTHLKNWVVTIISDSMTYKTFSQPPKPEVLSNYLRNTFPGGNYYSAYEAGFCGYWIHNKLLSLGINSIVVNPADIPTTDKEKVQKEDKRDSRKIARSLRNGDLTPIYVPSLKVLEDRSLLRTRALVIKDLTRYKNRIKSFLYFHGIDIPDSYSKNGTHWSNRFVNWLENITMAEVSGTNALSVLIIEAKHLRSTILTLNKQIRTLSKTDAYSKQEKLLQSVPGIGLLTAMTILTELETITRFNNIDKLCGFIGLVPSTHSSGENEKIGGITHRGHSVLRVALIESSWTAVRNDPALYKSYNEYCKRMEPTKAIIRIAKKLLSRIKYVLKNEQPYLCSVVK
jgi:transposase